MGGVNTGKTAVSAHETAIRYTLKKCPLFAGLSDQAICAVSGVCQLCPVAKGQFLFLENERAPGFYVMHSGAINVGRITPDGREHVIRIFYPPESFAEVLLMDESAFPADARAIEDSQAILVRRNGFRDLIRNDPDLALRVLASMSMHLKYLVLRLEDFQSKHAEARLAHWLLRNMTADGNPDGGVAEIPVTKRLLAQQLGIVSETFSRVLARFRDEGAIVVDGRRIRVQERSRLMKYLEG